MGHLSDIGRRSAVSALRPLGICCAVGAAMVAMGSMSGCTLLGGMIESYRQQSTHAVPGDYAGLEGKSVAVVVIADRSIEADFPGITGTINARINDNILK